MDVHLPVMLVPVPFVQIDVVSNQHGDADTRLSTTIHHHHDIPSVPLPYTPAAATENSSQPLSNSQIQDP